MSKLSIPENLSPQKPEPARILWVGSAFPTDFAPGGVQFQGRAVEVQFLKWQDSFAKVMDESYALVVGEISERGQLEILENLRWHQSETWVGAYFNRAPNEIVRRALNSPQLKFFIEGQDLAQDLENHLQQRDLFVRRNWLLREYYQRNKNLESLTSDLEKIVHERTGHLEQSNKDQTERIQNERTLIRFIKEIASLSAVEDVMKFLRRELRKFHKVGEIVLCLQYGANNDIYYFRNGSLQKSPQPGAFPFLKNKTAAVDLANLLGRPFGKAALFPVSLNLLTQFHQTPAGALLSFEHAMSPEEIGPFEEFINERLNPISIALDRVLLEQELDTISFRWEKTFDGIRDPIAIIDMHYQLLRSNRKFAMGPKSQHCFKSFANRDDICPGCPLQKALRNGEAQSGEVRAGDRIYQVWSYPIRLHANEKPTSFVNQYVDVTESRELYARMLQHEKMGAIGTLAGHIAHELNNPLTGIRSLTQVLMTEGSSDEVKKDLEEIEKAAARCQGIIKNLLEFTQEDETQKERVSLDHLVERTLPMLKTALRSHRLRLELQTPAEQVEVYPHLLQQVVFNLVNNACQAMKQAGEISIRTQAKENSVELSIADTGPGIAEADRARIFEEFFTTKPVGEGTGLGLSISKSIVEKCGGQITYESEVGGGTQFFLSFPRADS